MQIPTDRNLLKKFLAQSRVAVLGLGKSGTAAAMLLQNLGSKIFLSDQSDISTLPDISPSQFLGCEWNGHSEKILQQDLIILSPGIRCDLEILQKAREKNIPIWGELELAYRLLDCKKIAAVTGTNGKTTTVSWLADMSWRDGKKTIVGGNIGQALSHLVLTQILTQEKYDIAVLEISSYQLETIQLFRADVAAILNLTDDHLQRHRTMENYAETKKRIFLNQTKSDRAILNADDARCNAMQQEIISDPVLFSTTKILDYGVFYDRDNKKIIARLQEKQENQEKMVFDLPAHLPGMHNIANACAAVACAIPLGLNSSAIAQSLQHFKGVEHRIETVKTIYGVTYINDSKATNVDSTLQAILALEKPLWLILGGQDKGASYEPIRNLIAKRSSSNAPIKGLLLIGEATPIIESALKSSCKIYDCKTLKTALDQAKNLAKEGDIVLLSPACASFDQYQNFEQRGKDFKNCVAEIALQK